MIKKILGLSIILFLFATGCGDIPDPTGESGEVKKADDTYPFTFNGFVVSWEKNSSITVEIPDNANYRQIVVQALDAWKKILGKYGITVITTNTPPSDIKVMFNTINPTNGLFILGQAVFNPVGTGAPGDPNRYLELNINANNTVAENRVQMFAIALHEFGHIFGLWSHSFSDKDLMYPFYREENNGLSPRDIRTFEKAYSFEPELNLSSYPKNQITGVSLSPLPSLAFHTQIICRITSEGQFRISSKP